MLFLKNKNHSLLRRLGMAKALGAVVGIYWVFILGPQWFQSSPLFTPAFQWGMFFWWVTFGVMIGLFGLITDFPVWNKIISFQKMNKTLRTILRGGILGMWLELVLILLLYDSAQELAQMNPTTLLKGVNVLWLGMIEGFILGAIMDFICTRFGGEGKEIL